MNETYLWEFLDTQDDITIVDSFVKANSVINSPLYKTILCSISGGSDSDVMLDLISRVDLNKKVKYVWFNTGLEYQATKDHLDYLEQKYNIKIERERAIKPIPTTCREYGQPFLNKNVSDMLYRLQKHGFKWENGTLDELLKKYPNCKSALQWWCNANTVLNINRNRFLKEFIIANPPNFKISSKCCEYAKKNASKKVIKKYNVDLVVVGLRRAEGGLRSIKYKNCYSIKENQIDDYRPLFWYKDDNKERYEKKFDIKHSECYTKYGFRRTGCSCCPYGRELEDELKATELYEPKLYKAVCNIFKDSYEYTRKYREFVTKMKQQDDNQQIKGQMSINDIYRGNIWRHGT